MRRENFSVTLVSNGVDGRVRVVVGQDGAKISTFSGHCSCAALTETEAMSAANTEEKRALCSFLGFEVVAGDNVPPEFAGKVDTLGLSPRSGCGCRLREKTGPLLRVLAAVSALYCVIGIVMLL